MSRISAGCRGRSSGVLCFWTVSFILSLTIGALWMVGTPLFGVPDEPAHIVRAVSVARGELLGAVPSDSEFGAAGPYVRSIIRSVEVPAVLDLDVSTSYEPPCYAFKPNQDAGCLTYGHDTGALRRVPTTAGIHPPAWYALVGVPSLVSVDAAGIFGMRFVNVALTAAFVASAAVAVAWSRSPFGGIGLLFALTPMLFFLAGGVNSSGPEIAAAVALWSSLVVVLRTESPPTHLIAIAGVAATALVTIRRTGPLWVAIIITIAVLAAGSREQLDELARRRTARIWGLVTATALALQVAWMVSVGSLAGGGSGVAATSVATTVRTSLTDAYDKLIVEAVGNLGWLDTPVPAFVVVVWMVGIGGLAVIALAHRSIRMALAAGVTIAITLGSFVFFEVIEAADRPGFWQGRYSLPLAVGVPILLGLAMPSGVKWASNVRLRLLFAALFVGAHLAAFWQYLQRYTVGASGGNRFLWDYSWSPPLAPAALMLGYALAVALFALWLSGAVQRIIASGDRSIRP